MAALLHSCMVNCKGPKFPGKEPPPPTSLEDGYETSTHVLPAWKKITNYSEEHILSILESAEHQFEGLTQESNLGMAEAGEEENWGGLGEDKNLTTPHNRYYETVKHATHEACDLLDNIHSQVSPSCAISLYTEYQKALDEIRDKCRAALRETNTSLNIRDGSSTPVVHNIAGPPQNRTVRRTLHSFNANPRSAKRHRSNI